MSAPDPLLPVAVLKTLSSHTKDRYELARAEAADLIGPGDRRIVRSPLDNAKLGAVYMTDPPAKAVLTDEAELVAWLTAHGYDDRVESRYEVTGTAEQVEQVLFEHAPELLSRRAKLTSAAKQELLTDATAVGQAIGPGGEVDVPGIAIHKGEPVVACKPDPDALLAVYELVNSGRVMLDGTVLPELEAGE
jgi:hypothetical protein